MNEFSVKSDYIPLVDKKISSFRVIIPFARIAWFTVSIQCFSFIFCILWTIMYNFEESTNTHCKVYNALPSVSATIGHYQPQKNIWKMTTVIQAIIRFYMIILHYQYYKKNTYPTTRKLTRLALVTYVIENTSLVTLSFWTSNENYALHKLSFMIFLFTSFIYMNVSYIIATMCRSTTREVHDIISLKWKLRALISNLAGIILACYFFYRHNKYCEPFVYSLFALAEYLVVLTNMGFHVTAAYDFAGRSVLISRNGLKIL
ncbi:hypothetical protein TKK_0002685 [Trichogramma kaykai]|uniref:CWH43-like N-terminal domain-containing protein n=1 Tax=Trichogramma kaykai TaxID=54128 RepID=A0ABD2XTF1_9HYME